MSFLNGIPSLGQYIENNQDNSEQSDQSDLVTVFNETMQNKNEQDESPSFSENRKRKFDHTSQPTGSPSSNLKKVKGENDLLSSLGGSSPSLQKVMNNYDNFYGSINKDQESLLEDSIIIESFEDVPYDSIEKEIIDCMNDISGQQKYKGFLLMYLNYIIQVYGDEKYIISFMNSLEFSFKNDQTFMLEIIDKIVSIENSKKHLATFMSCLNGELKEDKSFMMKMIAIIAGYENSEKKLAIFMSCLNDELKEDKEFLLEVSTILFSSINENGNIGAFMNGLSEDLKKDSEFLYNFITMAIESVDGLELDFSVFMSNLIESLKEDEELFFKMVTMSSDQNGIIEDNMEGYEKLFLMAIESGYHKFDFEKNSFKEEQKFRLEQVKENGIVIDRATGEINNNKNFILKGLIWLLDRRKFGDDITLDLSLADEIIGLIGEDEQCAVEIFQQLSSGQQSALLYLLKLRNDDSTLYGLLTAYFIRNSTNVRLAKLYDFNVNFK